MLIDGNWDKPVWNKVESLTIANDNDWAPSYKPLTEVKLCYDDKHLYVIFRVQDRYVKCMTQKQNGPVWQDSCVEFFFSPDPNNSQKYFNIEINCSGYAHMAYQRVPRIDNDFFTAEDIRATRIAHTINGLVVEEIEQPMEWTIDYRLPFALLAKYAEFPYPKKGTTWMVNFFKCAENNSHPHWLS